MQPVRNTFPLKVPFSGNVKIFVKFSSGRIAQQRRNFFTGKHIVFSFFPLAVCILGGIKTAAGIRHFPLDILGRFPCHLPVNFFSGDGIRLGISHQQKGIVIQHFLKVGHQKIPVGGISGKSAADMIEDPAPVHLHQSFFRHFQGAPVPVHLVIFHQKHQIVGHGKFRRIAESPAGLIKAALKLPHSLKG